MDFIVFVEHQDLFCFINVGINADKLQLIKKVEEEQPSTHRLMVGDMNVKVGSSLVVAV